MPKYEKIEELLAELNRHRQLFANLFNQRMVAVREEAVLELMDDNPEHLERLEAYGLLIRNHAQVALDGRLQEFFEEYMEVDEAVHILQIQENLDRVKETISYHHKEHRADKRDRYLQQIKKALRRILRITVQNVKTLRRNTDETYKTEANFEIKREKLETIRTQRDQLEGVIRAVEKLLDDGLFFRTAADEELLQLVHQLRLSLHDSQHNLIEIQQQVITYLNHIEQRALVVEKALRLKLLRDKHYLRQQTNFYELAVRNRDLPQTGSERLQSRLSIRSLSEDEALHELVLKVRRRKKDLQRLAENRVGTLPDDAFSAETETERQIDLLALKSIFQGKQQDLFSFVQHHTFRTPVDETQRIRLYCQLASRYAEEFDLTEEVRRSNGLEYAVIYPGKRRGKT